MCSSVLARIPGFRQWITTEALVLSQGLQARGTRLLQDAKETSRLSQVFTSPPKTKNTSQNTRSFDNNWQKSGYRPVKIQGYQQSKYQQSKFKKKFQKNTEKTRK
jgi:hypothetical protein